MTKPIAGAEAIDAAVDWATHAIASGAGFLHCGDYESYRDAKWAIHLAACLAMAGALALAAGCERHRLVGSAAERTAVAIDVSERWTVAIGELT